MGSGEAGGAPVRIHTDLLRPNLLVGDGRLRAVIDFGGMGDPAADVVPAWNVFGAAGRAVYRDALAVDDGTWERARGYALHQAMIIPYYAETNPDFVALGAHGGAGPRGRARVARPLPSPARGPARGRPAW